MAEKQYDSTVSFQGKKLAQVKWAAEKIFEQHFLWIKVDHHEKEFIVHIDSESPLNKITSFKEEFKQCRLVIFKKISFDKLMGR